MKETSSFPISQTRPASSFIGILMRFGLLLPPTFLFAIKNDLPHILLITIVLLLLPVAMKQPLEYRDRPLIYNLILIMILTLLPDMLVTMDPSRFGLLDIVVRSNLAFPFLVYSAAVLCLFRKTPLSIALITGFAILSIMICGDIFSTRNLINKRFLLFHDVLNHYQKAYLICVILQLFFSIMMITSYEWESPPVSCQTKLPVAPAHSRIFRVCLKLLCMACIPFLIFGMLNIYSANTEFVKKMEMFFIQFNIRFDQNTANHMTNDKVTIGYLNDRDRNQLKDRILIWSNAKIPPGYLRIATYSKYHKNVWTKPDHFASDELIPITRTDMISYSTFYMPEAKQAYPNAVQYEIFLDSVLSHGNLPVPGDVYAIDIVSEVLSISPFSDISSPQWRVDGAYTIHAEHHSFDSAANHFSPERLSPYGRVDYRLKPALNSLKKEIFGNGPIPHNELERIQRVTSFLHSRFQYDNGKLSFDRRNSSLDPVSDFIQNTRAGHCELFATTAALLLREIGIPTRYVTGYVCATKHPSLDAFYATGANAHAWVEAYIQKEKRWILVEPTPASAMEEAQLSSRRSWYARIGDQIRYFAHQSMLLIRRGYFGQFVLNLLIFLAKFLLMSPFSVFVYGALAYYLFRKYQGQLRQLAVLLTHRITSIQRLERELDKLLLFVVHETRQHPHRQDETLRECLDRLPDRKIFLLLSPLVEQYEEMRFSNREFPIQESIEFRDSLKQVRKKLIVLLKARRKK